MAKVNYVVAETKDGPNAPAMIRLCVELDEFNAWTTEDMFSVYLTKDQAAKLGAKLVILGNS